jgi:hypothetical protein
LGYCGKDTAPAKLISCLVDGNCAEVKKELSKFIVLNPYLETIAKITGLEKFSYPVIEAYWFGNNKLKRVANKDYLLLLENFNKQGVPTWLIKELRNRKPNKFIPNHLFQVLFIGVGRASGSVPYNLETINNCMIRWGKVQKINRHNLTVNLNSLKKENGKYNLTLKKRTYTYRADILPGIKVGTTVAVHWKQVVKILTSKEIENLEYWTKNTLTSLYN